MNITEVTVVLLPHQPNEKLVACASFTIDNSLVVHDVKIIKHGAKLIVCMPSRKITGPCQYCKGKNCLSVAYCNHCGKKLANAEAQHNNYDHGRNGSRKYADIVHPINRDARKKIEDSIIAEYQKQQALTATTSP